MARQAVCREQDESVLALARRQRIDRFLDAVAHRLDEAGVVVRHAQLVEARCIGHAARGFEQVLAVTAATAVGAERARHERKRAAHAGVRHLRDGVRE
jgi:hypothetical protein